jgi:hypothetical protein
MIAQKPNRPSRVNTYAVIRAGVGPSDRNAGKLVKIIRETPAHYEVQEVFGDQRFTKVVFNAEIRFIKDEKELFLHMLKAK